MIYLFIKQYNKAKEKMNMKSLKLPLQVKQELKRVSRVAGYLWNREWAERNAGNLSINFTSFFTKEEVQGRGELIPYDFPKEVAGYIIFVTGAGSYLRTLIDDIEEAACIIYINEEATGYHIIWGGNPEGFRPTSELISHIKIHHFNSVHKPDHIAIMHTHPIELIVMSHHKLFQNEEKFNHSLWKMCPEVRVFTPKGVHCTPYALSGTEDLADVTIEGLKSRDVILWEKHGALATGTNMDTAFDLIDVSNKGAKLLLTCWSAGFEPVGLTEAELKELEQFF
jgi:rhamnulose-1-phosphate aldolase